ncbi:MAG: hypothetical protein FD167_3013, partial [bacterium]
GANQLVVSVGDLISNTFVINLFQTSELKNRD